MMKTTEEMIEVMQAHLRGEQIEFRDEDCKWLPVGSPAWDWHNFDYRIAPKPELTQDTIPWDAIDERFQWAARDIDNNARAFASEPTLGKEEWSTGPRSDAVGLDGVFSGYVPGTVDWRDSLQQRPAAEEKRP